MSLSDLTWFEHEMRYPARCPHCRNELAEDELGICCWCREARKPENSPENETERVKFTIFTPTFNRAHTLHRVYESLLEQTCRDFEWLVIDDGSTDNTSEMIDRFRKCQSLFPIRYYAQPNRGKHCAHNVAAKLAKGFFTANVDSDDRIIPNTLERCLYWWETLKEKWCGYSGIDGLAVDQYGDPIGDLYPDTPFDSQWNEHKFKHRIKGEHWGIVRTDVLREFPFPSLSGFVPEGIVWGQIGKKYLTRAVNEVFRIYYTHEA